MSGHQNMNVMWSLWSIGAMITCSNRLKLINDSLGTNSKLKSAKRAHYSGQLSSFDENAPFRKLSLKILDEHFTLYGISSGMCQFLPKPVDVYPFLVIAQFHYNIRKIIHACNINIWYRWSTKGDYDAMVQKYSCYTSVVRAGYDVMMLQRMRERDICLRVNTIL